MKGDIEVKKMRLIDADALKRAIIEYHNGLEPRYISKLVDAEIADIQDIIDEQPTVDAVPVVRCRECRFRGNSLNCPMCHEEDFYDEDDGFDDIVRDKTTDEGYCQKGEREDDNE